MHTEAAFIVASFIPVMPLCGKHPDSKKKTSKPLTVNWGPEGNAAPSRAFWGLMATERGMTAEQVLECISYITK